MYPHLSQIKQVADLFKKSKPKKVASDVFSKTCRFEN